MIDRVINPPKYNYYLKGAMPCSYGLNSTTMYRSLARPDDIKKPNQIEVFYKYDYETFTIDFAFRTFETDDIRQYNIFMVTSKGIFKEDITRSVLDNLIYMRWTTFVTKLDDYKSNLIIINYPENSKSIKYFFYDSYTENEDNTVTVISDKGEEFILPKSDQLMKSLKGNNPFIDVDRSCYVPIWNFRMWYLIF